LFTFWISFGILVSPIYILTLINPIYNARFSDVSIFSQGSNVVKEIINHYIEYFLPYFHFGPGDTDLMHQVPGFGNSYNFLSPFFYLGIIVCILGLFKKISIKKIDSKIYQLLLAWLLLFPLAASLTTLHNMVLRTIHGLPLVVIFFILFCDYIWPFLKKQFKAIFIVAIFLMGMANLYEFNRTYFNWYPKMSFVAFQYGISESLTYLDQNQDKFEKVVIDTRINQPYIFYLFFSKFDPNKLNYISPMNSSSKYTFNKIPGDLKTLPVYTVKFEESRMFEIYAEDSTWYVKRVF
jgi:hypothetical protein